MTEEWIKISDLDSMKDLNKTLLATLKTNGQRQIFGTIAFCAPEVFE